MTKHQSLAMAAGGQVSLHSAHGRFLLLMSRAEGRGSVLAAQALGTLSAAGGEVSLHSRYGRYLRKFAASGTSIGAEGFKSVEGEVSLSSPLGNYLQR